MIKSYTDNSACHLAKIYLDVRFLTSVRGIADDSESLMGVSWLLIAKHQAFT